MALLCAAGGSHAEPTYVANLEGAWVVHHQAGPGAEPVAVRPGLAFDASAPALAPGGSRVAFEVPGRGILVCALQETSPCREVRTEPHRLHLQPLGAVRDLGGRYRGRWAAPSDFGTR